MKINTILIKIDSTPEYRLREIMKPYIDTPGNYKNERRDYHGVQDYMESNMSKEDFNRLLMWIKKNPKQVKLLFKRKSYTK